MLRTVQLNYFEKQKQPNSIFIGRRQHSGDQKQLNKRFAYNSYGVEEIRIHVIFLAIATGHIGIMHKHIVPYIDARHSL